MTVTDVRQKPFADVSDREARDSGEPDREAALWQVMRAAYADMTRTDEVTRGATGVGAGSAALPRAVALARASPDARRAVRMSVHRQPVWRRTSNRGAASR